LDVLDGLHPDVVEWATEEGRQVGYIRPRPLKAFLQGELTRRLRELRLEASVIQVPDAHIASDDSAWISRCDGEGAQAPPPTVPPGPEPGPPPAAPPAAGEPEPVVPGRSAASSIALVRSLLRPVLADDLNGFDSVLERAKSEVGRDVHDLAHSVERAREPFGRSQHETQCGFKIRGTKFLEAFSPHVSTTLLGAREDVRAEVAWPGASVLLVFSDRTGALLPAIPGFLASLTVDEGELVDVAYEPSANTWRWREYADRAMSVRALRALAASSARDGVFRLQGADAETVARQMQLAKGVDPTLAVYAAYAYQDLQLGGRIRETSRYMRDDLGAVLFDIALLARELDGKRVGSSEGVFSFAPLLSQGWALLHALRVRLPEELDGVERMLLSSLWTSFAPRGVEQVRAALKAGTLG
jgi:hypothetical protein